MPKEVRDFIAMASAPSYEMLMGYTLRELDAAKGHSHTHGLSGYTLREIREAATITHLSPALCPCTGCQTRRSWHSA